jgi:hypothetical protein
VSTSPTIGTLNESPLHQALKAHYATAGSAEEVPVGNFVADVRLADSSIFEIQTSGFGQLRGKLESLLAEHRVVLVHPIARVRHIVKLPEELDQQATRRRSPKKGSVAQVVDELVSIPRLLNHPNFELEVVMIEEEELRRLTPGRARRRGGWRVVQRRLCQVLEQVRFRSAADLLTLVPGALPESFTTRDLAEAMGEPRWVGQKLAYCLRESGVIAICGKVGNALCYQRMVDSP